MAHPKTAPPIVQEVLRSSGQPLDSGVRMAMEARFGHDFSRVRVHDSARAAESAQAINARAYTAGRDIVFAAGAFSPQTDSGRRLLAHELTHVVQQSQSAGPASSRLGSLGIGPAGGRAESEASRIEAATVNAAQAGPVIQRQPDESPSGSNPAGAAMEGEEKMADCTTACSALEAMRRTVKRLCDLAGEKDQHCIKAREKLAASETRVIGMGCKCAMPIM